MSATSADFDDRIAINVSGRRFETRGAVLRRLPHSLLGDEQRRAAFWDAKRGEFFFDRCASSFEGVLLAYQTGCDASRPCGVPASVFLEDLRFFGLAEQAERLASGRRAAPPSPPPHSDGWRGRLATLFEQPVVTAASLLVTLVAVAAYVAVPVTYEFTESSVAIGVSTTATILMVVELVCVLLLFAELLLRLLVTRNVTEFAMDPLNVFDLLATVLFVVFFIAVFADLIPSDFTAVQAVCWLGYVARLLRLLRVFRFVRRTASGQTLKRTVVAAAPAIGVIFAVWVTAVLFFASLIYWVEVNVNYIRSIPEAMYWAVITMTTVGFGDIYATTPVGRLVSALCAYAGYVSAALQMAVLVINFEQCNRESCRDREHAASEICRSPPQTGHEMVPMRTTEMLSPTHVTTSLPSETLG